MAQLGMVAFVGAEPVRTVADVVDISYQDVWVQRWGLARFQSKLACIEHHQPALSSSSPLAGHHMVAAVSEAV